MSYKFKGSTVVTVCVKNKTRNGNSMDFGHDLRRFVPQVGWD